MDDPLVCVVDDDDRPAIHQSAHRNPGAAGAQLRQCPRDPGRRRDLRRAHCLVLDVRMPGLSGMGLQERLARLGHDPAHHLRVGPRGCPDGCPAMRDGAFDFLPKPFNEQALLDRIQEAVQLAAAQRAAAPGWPRSRRASPA